MRILKLNNRDVDIDEKTAIGITFQGYDFKNPAQRKSKITNTFTIPATSNNMQILGFAGNPEWVGEEVNSSEIGCEIYNEILCNYWINNDHLLKDAKIRIGEIGERISILVVEKSDFWDNLKDESWESFQENFATWLGVPNFSSPVSDTWENFITHYTLENSNPIFTAYLGNLFAGDASLFQGGEGFFSNKIRLLEQTIGTGLESQFDVYTGGHWACHAVKVFQYIEETYNVNFLTPANYSAIGQNIPANIFDDPQAQKIIVPMRNWRIARNNAGEFFFDAEPDNPVPAFNPYENIKDKEGKTLYDFVISFFKYFNILIDEIELNNNDVFALRRFDDIEDFAEIKNISDRLTGNPIFNPVFSDFAQNNYIKFTDIYPQGSKVSGQRVLTSNNKNTEFEKDFFEIDAYYPDFVSLGGELVLNLSTEESFKTFEFLTYSNLTQIDVSIEAYFENFSVVYDYAVDLPIFKAEVYGLDSEYQLIDRAIKYPKFYKAKFWLTNNDIRNLEYFKLWYVRQLNGSFLLNKINGYNPEKSKQPVDLELVRISDKAPLTPSEAQNYYTDIRLDGYTDILNDFYY